MNHNRLPEAGALFLSVWCLILVGLMGMAAAHAHEPYDIPFSEERYF